MAASDITIPGLDLGLPAVLPGGGGITLPGAGSILTEDEARRRETAAYEAGRVSMRGWVLIGLAGGAFAGFLLKGRR